MATPPVTDRPPYDAFLHKLAGKPMLVTGLTFLLAATVTIVLLVAEPTDVDILGVISLGATIWGLTLALVIYLLTAQDTDRVMDQIADLKEQLAASLIDPDDSEQDNGEQAVSQASVEPIDEPQTAREPLKRPLPVAPAAPTSPDAKQRGIESAQRAARGRSNTGGMRSDREAMVYRADAGVPVTERIPVDYVEAWCAATGRDADQIIRGWTRGRSGQSPWVIQAADGTRWSVFSSGEGSPSVIELDDPRFRGSRGNHQRRQIRTGRGEPQSH